MEIVHTCPDARYWSEVLCCNIPTHMSDHKVKVTDLEKVFWLWVLEAVLDSGELRCPTTALII